MPQHDIDQLRGRGFLFDDLAQSVSLLQGEVAGVGSVGLTVGLGQSLLLLFLAELFEYLLVAEVCLIGRVLLFETGFYHLLGDPDHFGQQVADILRFLLPLMLALLQIMLLFLPAFLLLLLTLQFHTLHLFAGVVSTHFIVF